MEQIIPCVIGHRIAALQYRAELFGFDANALRGLGDGFGIEGHSQKKLVKENFRDQEPEPHGTHRGDYAREHERVIQKILADPRRSRAIELNRGNQSSVVRNEKITVYRREHANQRTGGNAQRKSEGHQRARGCCLAVEQHGRDKQTDRERPRGRFRHPAQATDNHFLICSDECVAQPRQPKNAD